MKNYLSTLTKKATFVLAITFAAAVGSASTVLVRAAIPDTNSTIHACYRNNSNLLVPKGNLRVIDSDNNETCTSQETALNWSASGGHQIAYAALNSDGTLDTSYSSGINSVKFVPFGPDDQDGYMCFDVSFSPKSAYASQDGINMTVSNRMASANDINDICGSGYNAYAANGIVQGYFQNPYYTFLN